MQIKQYVWEIIDSNSFLLTEQEQGLSHGLMIDAVSSPALYKRIEALDSLRIILTHSHFDHIIGLNRIRELKPDCTVIATEQCSRNIGNRYRNLSCSATAFLSFYEGGRKKDMEIEPFICDPADLTFQDHLKFDWAGHTVELYAVHGHTSDGLVVRIGDILFSGDTLLNIPTVTRFPSGNSERFLKEDLPLIKGLNVELVYPGHGNPGRLEQMMFVNNMEK